MTLKIRSYRAEDEEEWLKCHMLVYLDASGGELLKEKTKYEGESIELVATIDDKIVGFLDIELESSTIEICHKKAEGNGMLWDIGIMKEHRSQRIGTRLLEEGIKRARKYGLRRLEAWTIEEDAKKFYETFGFKKFYEYHHVSINKREKLRPIDKDGIHITYVYAHVMPDTDINTIIEKYDPEKVHVCTEFENTV